MYQILRHLGRRHSVSLLAYTDGDEADKVKALSELCEAVHTVPAPVAQGGKRLSQLVSIFSSRSYQGRQLYSEVMQRKLDELCAGDGVDVIQVESSQMAVFRFDRRAAVVLDEHDIVYELLQRMSQTERSPFRRAYNWAEYRKFRREERATWQQMSACVTTSEREVPIIKGAGVEAPVVAVPNGVDVDYFRPADEPIDDNAIVMTGLMKTRPNADGAVYFVRDVLPRILAVRPQLVLYLVGGEPPDEVVQLRGPNVIVTGGVPDVRPFVGKAAVVVVPLRMGGGTRLKVLEGLAMKKPMVSTSLGCEGIDVRHEEHLLVADQPAALADSVLRLIADRPLGATLAAKGYELVNQRYRWEIAVERLEQLHQHVARARAATGRA